MLKYDLARVWESIALFICIWRTAPPYKSPRALLLLQLLAHGMTVRTHIKRIFWHVMRSINCRKYIRETHIRVWRWSVCVASAWQQAIISFWILWILPSRFHRALVQTFFSNGICHAAAHSDSSSVLGCCHDVRGWGKPQRERRQLGAELRLLSQCGEAAADDTQVHGGRCGYSKATKRSERAGTR